MTELLSLDTEAAELLGLDPASLGAFVGEAVAEHKRLLAAGGPDVRKNAPETAITLVRLPGRPTVCVKEFRRRGWLHALKSLFRDSQATRTFRNGRRLNQEGIRAPRPVALLRTARLFPRSEWVVMEVIPAAIELDRYILKQLAAGWPAERKRSATRSLARLISSMHARGIFHSDLKTCNILVKSGRIRASAGMMDRDTGGQLREGACGAASSAVVCGGSPPSAGEGTQSDQLTASSLEPGFALLDYDDVGFSRTISRRMRAKNLVQIFLSTPSVLGPTDRMRFLREYAKAAGLGWSEARILAREVMDAARGRRILYVGFEGDVIENWEAGPGR